jgi:hypothetical protein
MEEAVAVEELDDDVEEGTAKSLRRLPRWSSTGAQCGRQRPPPRCVGGGASPQWSSSRAASLANGGGGLAPVRRIGGGGMGVGAGMEVSSASSRRRRDGAEAAMEVTPMGSDWRRCVVFLIADRWLTVAYKWIKRARRPGLRWR